MSRPDFEMYPDEIPRFAAVLIHLGNQFEFAGGNETDRRIFEMAAHNEFGKVGIKVHINWGEICYPDGTPSGVFRPEVEPYGRTKGESQTDHDRIKWGVARGLDGGEPGYIREDGSVHEEPRKRDII